MVSVSAAGAGANYDSVDSAGGGSGIGARAYPLLSECNIPRFSYHRAFHHSVWPVHFAGGIFVLHSAGKMEIAV